MPYVAVQEVGIALRKYMMLRCVAVHLQKVGIMWGHVNISCVQEEGIQYIMLEMLETATTDGGHKPPGPNYIMPRCVALHLQKVGILWDM